MKEYDELHDINLDDDLSFENLRDRLSPIAMDNLQASLNETNQLIPAMSAALLDAVQMTFTSVESVVQTLQSISKYISEAAASLQVPGCPEEYRKRLVESYRAWGNCGWAWIGATPLKFYYTPPRDNADANKRIRPYHSKEEVGRLFDRLQSKKIRKSDLDSAIFCYQSRQYKPCAIMLFGMIDAKLIREQVTNKNYRPAGETAAKRLKEKYERESDRYGFFALLRFANLFACLETIFITKRDFKEEPPIINRNYLCHGMNQRPVLKRDCIQLFFILESLLEFLDYPWNA